MEEHPTGYDAFRPMAEPLTVHERVLQTLRTEGDAMLALAEGLNTDESQQNAWQKAVQLLNRSTIQGNRRYARSLKLKCCRQRPTSLQGRLSAVVSR